MMRYRYQLSLFVVSLVLAIPALAAYQEDQPPNVYDYIALPPPKPNPIKEFFKHIYISGRLGAAQIKANSIKVGPSSLINTTPTFAAKTKASDIILNKGFAIGYQFLNPSWFQSRIELEYMDRNGLEYNANPPFTGSAFATSTLSSKVRSQTFMTNLYLGIKLGPYPFVPFAIGGIGIARNQTQSSAWIYDNTGGGSRVSSALHDTQMNFAWNAGLGITYLFNSHISTDLYYDYVSLGTIEWQMRSNNTNYGTPTLSTKNFFAHNINFSLNIRL